MSSDSSEDMSRPSKKRRCTIKESSSDSDSDDSVILRSQRKRRVLKVVSDIDDSSDDGSDIARPARRVNGKTNTIISEDDSDSESDDVELLQLESDESTWESDWMSSDSSAIEEVLPKKSRVFKNNKPGTTSPASSCSKQEGVAGDAAAADSSDESDGQGIKCPICLLSFKQQQVATPASCDHCFCLLCLTEWSKNVNTCPVDRQPFTSIHVRLQPNGKIVQKIPVEPKNPTEEPFQEDPTYCEICRECDREDRMLLCDGCDLGYHLECLTPPMDQVPWDEWYCPRCSETNVDISETIEMDTDELTNLMEEARCLGVTYGRTRSAALQNYYSPLNRSSHHHRLIPRTRQTERVRANIRAGRRRQEHRFFDPDQPSTSSGIESIYDSNSHSDLVNSVIERVGSAISQSGRRRVKSTSKKNTKKKRTTATRKKTTSRSTSDDGGILREVRIKEINENGEEEEVVTYVKLKTTTSAGKKKKRTKRKRKKLKRNATNRRTLPVVYLPFGKTVRKNLAITLGMIKGKNKKKGSGECVINHQPSLRSTVEIINTRYRAGISQVSLFGDNLGLNYSPPGSDEETIPDSLGYSIGSGVAIQRRNVSLSSTRRRLAAKGMTLPNTDLFPPTPASTPPAANFLDNILSSQELWHSKTNKITLKSDGTFVLPEDSKKSPVNDENANTNLIKDSHRLSDKADDLIDKKLQQPVDLTSVSSEDVTQAPMYNNSRGGGGPRGGGGGGGNRGNNYHGGRDNYSYSYSGGRQNYNNHGGGMPPRGFGPRGPADFSPNFDNRTPPNFNNSFRFRNSHNFRNDNRPRQPFMPNFPRTPNQMFRGVQDQSYPSPVFTCQPPPNFPPENNASVNIERTKPEVEGTSAIVASSAQKGDEPVEHEEAMGLDAAQPPAENPANDEDCDIYADIESSNNKRSENTGAGDRNNDGEANNPDITSMALLPPPEPPSELLLDLEENLKNDNDEENNKESDDEDLVIDDSLKEAEKEDDKEKGKKPEERKEELLHSFDKYDPFQDADSDDESQSDCPNFSIYSSETMDVARHTEQQLAQEIGPLEPPPLPPDIPDDDMEPYPLLETSEIPEPPAPPRETPVHTPIDPYVESLRKERQQLSKIPSKKISTDSRGKITFKIGNKNKIVNKLSSLYDEIDDSIATMIEQEKELESSLQESKDKKSTEDKDIGEASQEKSEEPLPAVEQIQMDLEKADETDDECKIIDKECDEKENEDDKAEEEVKICEDDEEEEEPTQPAYEAFERMNDWNSTEDSDRGGTPPLVPNILKNLENCVASESSDINNEEESLSQDFQLEKEIPVQNESEKDGSPVKNQAESKKNEDGWYSDGAYTPCKDEHPLTEKETRKSFESDLEPITPPPKDHSTDDLDRCRTPVGYAGLGTEAISETDEAINFEEELSATLFSGTKKIKEIEDGEIENDDSRLSKKKKSSDSSDNDGDNERKSKKKDRRTKSKDAEKNKENISSDNNQVSWKKLSKSTKERQYREKMKRKSPSKERNRERSRRDRNKDYDKDKDKEKSKGKNKSKERSTAAAPKEIKKKEKRKELPRYDVRKIVAEKPRQRKDEYGRDIRVALSKSRSRGRSPVRKSHSYSPRRSWSRHISRSWSNHRRRSVSRGSRASSKYSRSPSRSRRSRSRSHSRTHSRSRLRTRSRSRSRRKSPLIVSRRRSLSRKHSRSQSPRKSRRSMSPRRQRKNQQKRSVLRKRKSRSRSRKKEKSKKHKSRSRSRRRKRSWSKTPQPAPRREKEKKRSKKKFVVERSRSRERSSSRNWENINVSRSLERSYVMRNAAMGGPVSMLPSGILDKDPINHTTSQNQAWSNQWTPTWSRRGSKSRSRSRSSVSLNLDPVAPKNLTVILTNKEAIKKKKKEKRLKEGKKRRDDPEGLKKRDKRNRTPPPSKEVFASGDNILVSVCFNNDNTADQLAADKALAATNCDSISNQLADTIASLNKKRRKRTYREMGVTPLGALSKETPVKKPKKDKTKDKRHKSPEAKRNRRDKKKKSKAAEIAASKKPVAVIDLDQSPFREQTPSPKDIIVLSDDEDNDLAQPNPQFQQQNQGAAVSHHQNQQKPDDQGHQEKENQNDNSQRDEFVGPKTPPEPQIKFSINKQSNLRPSMMNPLIDEEDDDEVNDDGDDGDSNTQLVKSSEDKANSNKNGKIDDLQSDLLSSNDGGQNDKSGNEGTAIEDELDDLEAMEILEMNERTHSQQSDNDNQGEMEKHTEERRIQEDLEGRLKIGPNTPPDPPTSPPTSPDAYDPFDPTKSRSPTPTVSQDASIGIDSGLTNDSMKNQGKENFSGEKRDGEKPKIISMVTIKRPSSPSNAANIINLEKSDDNKAKTNSNISTSIGNPFTTINPVLATVAAAVQRIGIQRNLSNAQIKQRSSQPNQLPSIFMNSVKGRQKSNVSKQNGNEVSEVGNEAAATIDTSSPYSPGSSLSDGIFDPPPHHHHSPVLGNMGKKQKAAGKEPKKDAFDALFGSSPVIKAGNKARVKKTDKRKRATNSKVGVRMDENELQILDDLPSSAVEMQVKDKFLKKLNRQERVVEEVKLVLKPHYTKKHVTKEEYKDIMRKAVPKICHNRSGEINPKKIAQLVEAYVRKCRNNKKKTAAGIQTGNSMAKNLRPTKTLWS